MNEKEIRAVAKATMAGCRAAQEGANHENVSAVFQSDLEYGEWEDVLDVLSEEEAFLAFSIGMGVEED